MTRHSIRTAPRASRSRALAAGVVVVLAAALSAGVAPASAEAAPAANHPAAAVRPTATTAAAQPRIAIAPTANVSPHGPYGTMTVDACALCHRAHTAKSSALLVKSAPQSTLCLTCHDGTGAATIVAQEYAGAKPNVPSKTVSTGTVSEYYQHDALVPTTHTLSVTDEFSGMLNRHTECSDCHSPHDANATHVSTPAAGVAWPLSGVLSGTSGVKVTNGAANTAPTYQFLDGKTTPVTFEYQLCLKCHSGFTTLLSKTGVSPSAWALDAGIEFNPNNASFHPVEGSGKNTSQKMKDSLAGTSPYKLWRFSVDGADGYPSTVRCTNCHANGASVAAPSAPGDVLDTHTSANRGILLRNYRDRDLQTSTATYADDDYALCYLCHTNTPFKTETSTGTNFKFHFKHVSALDHNPGSDPLTSLNIDTPGAGVGNALCSECHYRTHSTATGSKYTRLVNFSPNVLPYGSSFGLPNTTPIFQSNTPGTGTCTLRCHGTAHNNVPYTP